MEPLRTGSASHITVTPEPRAVNIDFHGAVIASTLDALVLREGGYPPVYYIPRGHVAMAFLQPSNHRTTCPHKGEARYWSISAEGHAAQNAVWSYENPTAELSAIAGYLAFYPDKVTIHVGGPEGE